VTVTQIPLPGGTAALIGLAALAVTVLDSGWLILRHGTVMAHEGAHAAASAMLFHKVSRIKLNMDATGATYHDPAGCLGSVFVGFAGYIGPSLFGLAAAKMIETDHILAVLWVGLFLLALLLVIAWMSFGMITVVLVGGLVFLVLRYTPLGAQIAAAYAITWLLLLTGVRRILEIGAGSQDGKNLASQTLVPRVIWFLLWLGCTLTAVAIGGKWLVLRS
jgi:Peptidase M50B-like